MKIMLATFVLLTATTAAHGERRCGWLSNPATAKWELYDAQGGWEIMFRGGDGHAAQGMDKIPDLTTGEYVRTFAIHGYACACLNVDIDTSTTEHIISRIYSVKQLPLAKCRDDPAVQYFLQNDN
ncbi:Hypothetical protein RG1141_PB01570 (plasmid) [Neorhizobium galegae bv. officinalis bv. officinalis str. HAMBI 1141]|uniref:DUF4087 domain-containing protein n=1 Tax=Neorhizobium galegae bv. officinalis bv. officinalis str. HAMBI 1141 TaxID=1028801 RepID=A0A068TLR6_NEOGA|nr:DUF4087 domain-containing protein [Neorhizobium galegae]CDN58505.1 Hypothetical protein RG1141_PB01570 [Neorhizobium galegae bv. officinalis bv. officinalis str. HAMBI 1141]